MLGHRSRDLSLSLSLCPYGFWVSVLRDWSKIASPERSRANSCASASHLEPQSWRNSGQARWSSTWQQRSDKPRAGSVASDSSRYAPNNACGCRGLLKPVVAVGRSKASGLVVPPAGGQARSRTAAGISSHLCRRPHLPNLAVAQRFVGPVPAGRRRGRLQAACHSMQINESHRQLSKCWASLGRTWPKRPKLAKFVRLMRGRQALLREAIFFSILRSVSDASLVCQGGGTYSGRQRSSM